MNEFSTFYHEREKKIYLFIDPKRLDKSRPGAIEEICNSQTGLEADEIVITTTDHPHIASEVKYIKPEGKYMRFSDNKLPERLEPANSQSD